MIEKMLKLKASETKLKIGQTSIAELSMSAITDSKASEISPNSYLKNMPSTSLQNALRFQDIQLKANASSTSQFLN